MQSFYPLYVSAMLYDQSQQVGMAKLLLYDSFETGFGSIEVYDNTFIGKDAGGGPMGFVTVRDIDGIPGISARTIEFTNGTVTDQGSGVARITISGGGGTPTAITVATEGSDTTCFPAFFTAGSGDLGPKTNAGLLYNSATNALTATTFVGALTGNASTVTTNANLTGHITSTGNATLLGSFTKAQLDTAVSDGNVLYVGDVTIGTMGTKSTYPIQIALSGNGANISSGTKKGLCRVPFAGTITGFSVICDPANEPSAAAVEIDLNSVNLSTGVATSVLSSVASIATGTAASTGGAISGSPTVAVGDLLSLDIDQGSDGKELVATITITAT